MAVIKTMKAVCDRCGETKESAVRGDKHSPRGWGVAPDEELPTPTFWSLVSVSRLCGEEWDHARFILCRECSQYSIGWVAGTETKDGSGSDE